MTLLDIMLHNAIRFVVLIAVFAGIDWYCWFSLHGQFREGLRLFNVMYGIGVAITLITLVLGITLFVKADGCQTSLSNAMMAFLFILLIPKIGFALIMLLGDVGRALFGLIRFLLTLGENRIFPQRPFALVATGVVFAGVLFVAVLHGVLWGKSMFTVHRQEVYVANLPTAFEGFTITQLSDIHFGSFSSKQDVIEGLTLANKQKSDIIVFTGDMVNSRAIEAEPYQAILSELSATSGKFAILGNHDYGDYHPWESIKQKAANLQRLNDLEQSAGFTMLNNASVAITRNNQTIYLAGVENWGKPPFPQHGNFNKAMKNVPNNACTILLSHDPSHWDAEVLPSKRVALTLSGHTHGMQFGIETPWFRFCPVQLKYPRWAGLYAEDDNYLYVNRGFGFVALPGRIGIWPEITVLTLRRK